MERLGQEFIERFPINYEKVYDFSKDEMIDVGGYAWPSVKDGFYSRVEHPFNHAFMRMYPAHFAFDNYKETETDKREFVKKLVPNYKFMDYGYRIIISKGQARQLSTTWQWLANLFYGIIKANV